MAQLIDDEAKQHEVMKGITGFGMKLCLFT